MATGPTCEGARLLLELYDLRREKVLRRARDFVGECKFKDFRDFQRRYPEGSKENRYVGMVCGYWDMACALVNRGLVDEDLFQELTYEHVGVWQKLAPLVEVWRDKYHAPGWLRSLQEVAGRHPMLAAAPAAKPEPRQKPKRTKKKSKR